MKTVKLTIYNEADVLDEMRIFSSIVRVAFNRYQDGMEEKEVRSYCNARFNHNSWFIQSAIKEAAALYKLSVSKHILCGGKNNLRQYMRGLIDKTTFKYRRMFPIGIQGEKRRKGNRLFSFDLDNQRLIYKPNKERHVEIRFLPMKKKIANELSLVQELAEHNKITVSIKLSDKYVWLTYDETLIRGEGYKKFDKGWFYPRFNIQFRDEQWKQTLGSVETWKELFRKIKETGLKYRFLLLDHIQNAVFSKNYIQKCYTIYTFA